MDAIWIVTVINVLITNVVLTVHNVNAAGSARTKKVSSYWLPEARELKQALGYQEDAYLNFTELTNKYGYPSEEHTVTTEDGYILTIFRLLSKCSSAKQYPVLLMHGLMDSSDVYIVPGTEIGIAYVLADNCYDVWAANHRGNVYSRKHVSLNPNEDFEFWNYSFDEHGNYDLPALIDYILRVSGKPKLFYVGHSQGTTDFFVMSSLRPEYNEKIQLSIQIAPVAWLTNLKSPLLRSLIPLARPIREFLDGAGFPEILARHQLIHFITDMMCQFVPDLVCGTSYQLLIGLESGSLNPNVLSIAFGHLLAGTPTKNLLHFAQLVATKKFQRFDEGLTENMKRYQTRKPPAYNVSQISSPVVLISAKNDFLSSLEDVAILSSKLPNLVENYEVPLEKWSHVNHVYDDRAPKYVHTKILDYLERFSS